MDNSYGYKSEYLYKAIEDTGETIRFLDTKAGAVFAGISICLTLLQISSGSIQNLYIAMQKNTILFGVLAFLFLTYSILVILSLFYSFKTIKPKDSIIIQTDNYTFYQLWYIGNKAEYKNQAAISEYYEKLRNMSKKDCTLSILAELLKLSYIRNLKLKNSNLSIMFFVWSLIPLGMIYICMLLTCFK